MRYQSTKREKQTWWPRRSRRSALKPRKEAVRNQNPSRRMIGNRNPRRIPCSHLSKVPRLQRLGRNQRRSLLLRIINLQPKRLGLQNRPLLMSSRLPPRARKRKKFRLKSQLNASRSKLNRQNLRRWEIALGIAGPRMFQSSFPKTRKCLQISCHPTSLLWGMPKEIL